jgi:spore germination protein
MIEAAYDFNVLPVLTLTPFDESGKFSNELISAVINNEETVETLIDNLIQVMHEKQFLGIDIDFEYIKAEDRESFVQFVARVTERMNEQGFVVSVDLAPKTSANQQGLLYEGKDYGAIGKIADSVLVMTYEWGYTYGPPMAVAPINKVRKVLDYAVTEIPPEKMNMGIPNYGYDWPLPYENGVTKATTIGNIEAVQIAIENGSQIFFDELAQTPYFHYRKDGIEHEVWFEDSRSIQAKMELVYEYGLRGISYWQIMQLFRANWELVDYNFNVLKSSK